MENQIGIQQASREAGSPRSKEVEEKQEAEVMRGELVVDERGRTSLARVRAHNYHRYTVVEFPDGTLVLTPAITISPVELAALREPAVVAAAAEAKAGDRSLLRRRPRRGSAES